MHVLQNTSRRAPDVALFKRHGIKAPLGARKRARVCCVVAHVHEEGERYLEGIGNLARIELELKAFAYDGDDRNDAIAGSGAVRIEVAERIDETLFEPDLLVRLAQRGGEGALVLLLHLAA